jgi:hypothetical protein
LRSFREARKASRLRNAGGWGGRGGCLDKCINILQYNPDTEAEDREGDIWMPVPGWLVEGNNTWVSNQGRVRNSNGLVFTPERRQDGYVEIGIRDPMC